MSDMREPIGYLDSEALAELRRGHPAKIYAPENMPWGKQHFVYLEAAPAAVPEKTIKYLASYLNEINKAEESDRDYELEAHLDKALRALSVSSPEPKSKGYAGVTMWVGDKSITQVVTEPMIKYERVKGGAMRFASLARLDSLEAAEEPNDKEVGGG